MEEGAGREVSSGKKSEPRLSYWQALKVVAAPIATVSVVVGTVFAFAADAYIRRVVKQEVAALAISSNDASHLLTEHQSRLAAAESRIQANSEEIDEVDDKFTSFVREILSKL